MHVDRASFLMILSTLGIGSACGYVASEKRMFPALDRFLGRPDVPAPEPRVVAPPVDASPPETASAPPPPPPAPMAPACDDSVGTVGACPPPGHPTIEGGCGSFANVRCGELKVSMKPKVAAAAVSCLTKLTPQERCDHARVYLCGHLALMNACPEPEPTAGDAGVAAVLADAAPSVTNAAAHPGGAAPHAGPAGGLASVTSMCQGIIDACGASPVAPSMTECRQLLSGMTETGRERTRACMRTHCFDRGLVGCEAAAPQK